MVSCIKILYLSLNRTGVTEKEEEKKMWICLTFPIVVPPCMQGNHICILHSFAEMFTITNELMQTSETQSQYRHGHIKFLAFS